jgi:hypothetical protein
MAGPVAVVVGPVLALLPYGRKVRPGNAYAQVRVLNPRADDLLDADVSWLLEECVGNSSILLLDSSASELDIVGQLARDQFVSH